MNQTWQRLLQQNGAHFSADKLADFGSPAAELAAAANGTVMVPLLEQGVIRVGGEDAAVFLHNLLTNDIKRLAADGAQYNGLCSPKGRLLASFLIWRDGADYLLQTERELLPALQKKFSMYVLRSKVRISDAGDEILLVGIAGAGATAALTHLNAVPPEIAMAASGFAHGRVIRVGAQRYQLAVKAEVAGEVWQALCAHAQAAGGAVWRWLEITAGLPHINAATQDQFVPQMANFELIGGVNFKKGCYPGQEIVARTQYLGKLKRRMYLAHLAGEATPVAGTPLYAPDLPDQACGMVVDAAPAPGGGQDLLAVVLMGSVEAGDVRVGVADGVKLEFRPLPYAVT